MSWRDASHRDRGPHLVNRPVRVLWEVPGLEGGAYYEGMVIDYDPHADSYGVKYPDDDQVGKSSQ